MHFVVEVIRVTPVANCQLTAPLQLVEIMGKFMLGWGWQVNFIVGVDLFGGARNKQDLSL